MNPTTEKPVGVLGRGPAFWAVMVFLTTALIVTLAATGAIAQKTPLLLLTIVPIALALVMLRSRSRVAGERSSSCASKGAAHQRYIQRVAICTSLYLATFALLTFSDRELEIAYEMKFALAIPPGLALVGVFWAIGRLIIEEKDEFLKLLVVRQSLIASGIAVSAATIWGFLERAEVVAHIDAYWWAFAWFLGLFIGGAINRVQYGTWGRA